MKKYLLWAGVVLFGLVLAVSMSLGPRVGRFLSHSTVEHDPGLTIFLGYGGNTILLRSEDRGEALIVDTKMFGGARRLRGMVSSLCPHARLTIVNTHCHRDHAGGNSLFPGARVIAGDYDDGEWISESGGQALPDVRLKPGQEIKLRIGKEKVRIKNYGRAHTRNDTVVYLESRKILVTGDLVFNKWHPALLEKSGTNVSEWVGVLERLMRDYDCDTVVPGHGPVAGRQVLSDMRDYFISIQASLVDRERLASLKSGYRRYYSIPFISGFKKSLRFIEKESARNNGAGGK